jgi:hypothetical protein
MKAAIRSFGVAGRWPFVNGAAFVGAGTSVTAWRTRGLRHVLIWPWATDACGVAPARFRLARRPRGRP